MFTVMAFLMPTFLASSKFLWYLWRTEKSHLLSLMQNILWSNWFHWPSTTSFSNSHYVTTNRLKLSRPDHNVLKPSCLLRSCLVFMFLRWFGKWTGFGLGHRKVRWFITLCHVPQNMYVIIRLPLRNSAEVLWETGWLSNTPHYLFLLSTKGKDSSDGWQHFLSHCSSLGVGRLFLRCEWCHHLMR